MCAAFQNCLKREQDISIKPMFSRRKQHSGKVPPLIRNSDRSRLLSEDVWSWEIFWAFGLKIFTAQGEERGPPGERGGHPGLSPRFTVAKVTKSFLLELYSMHTYTIFVKQTGGENSNKRCLSRTSVNKSHPKKLEYRTEFLGDITKKISNFVTSCLPENFPSLPIVGKILRFPEEAASI